MDAVNRPRSSYEAAGYLRPALTSRAPQGIYAGVAVIVMVTLSFGLARLLNARSDNDI